MRSLLLTALSALSTLLHGQQTADSDQKRSITVDVAGVPMNFLTNPERERWRNAAGYAHSPFGKPWITLTHSVEFMRYQETFETWWFFQYPFTPSENWFVRGRLDTKQVSYVIGLRLSGKLGNSPLSLFAEPRLGLGYRWGRKMADLSDAGMDFDVHEFGVSARMRAGADLRMSTHFGMEAAADLASVKYMGSGKSTWQLWPVLNLKYAF